MNGLNEHFKEGKSKNNKKDSFKGRLSSLFYFMIPLFVLTAINIYFLYILLADFKFIANIPYWASTVFLLSLYLISKILISGKNQLKEKAIIVGAIHSLFIISCLASLFLGNFDWYIKGLLAIWATIRTKFLWNDLKIIWISERKRDVKNQELMI